MYIETVPNRNSRPAILLREGWREGHRTRKRTLANLTDWTAAQVEALRAVLKGNYQSPAPAPGFSIERTRPHGHVAAVLGSLRRLGLERLLAPQRCAERDAVVLSVAKVSVGSVMQSGDEFITLVPTDAALEVEGNVPGFDAGYVHVGDSVVVKFDTFDYLLHGYARGTVRMVSADSFTNPNADRERVLKPDGNLGVQTNDLGELFFRSRISIDHVGLHGVPPDFRIAPGMPVSTEIKVGTHTLFNYLLCRVLPVISEGMREP